MASATPPPRAFAAAALRYFGAHRAEVARTAGAALGRELRFPAELLEAWARLALGDAPARLPSLRLRSPGFRLEHRVDAVGTLLDVVADLEVEAVRLAPSSIRIAVRATSVSLTPVGKPRAPLKALLDSGAIDFRQIGALASWAPEPHPAVVFARGDRLELDLMRVPRLAEDARIGRFLDAVTPWVTAVAVRATDDALHLRIGPSARGPRAALRSASKVCERALRSGGPS